MTLYDVSQSELTDALAKELRKLKELTPPDWAAYAKTGASKMRPPQREDWWQLRAASVLRQLYQHGPIGVSKLRTKYGGKRNRGVKPEHFVRASGSVLRHILQQLDAAGLCKQAAIGVHKGRVLTPKGVSLVDKTAQALRGARPVAPKQEESEAPKPRKRKAKEDGARGAAETQA